MTKRSYDQPECGLATALDLLGERWTLLIIRELLLGPQRYTDLNEALPGVSTNLLAGRLRHLEDVGIVVRNELPPPAACTVYELTEVGDELEPLILQLAQWGARFTDCEALTDPRTAAFAMLAHQSGVEGVTETGECQIDIGDMSIAAHVEAGRLHARAHAPASPVAVLRTDCDAYLSMLTGSLTWTDAKAMGAVSTEGDETQLAAIFGFPPAT